MNKIIVAIIPFLMCACNSVYMKPGTIDPNEVFYAKRGGFGMQRSIKEEMEERGYNVRVGKAKSSGSISGEGISESIDLDSDTIPTNARYIIRVRERREIFNPIWCPLNGFWWWNFNVSIADNKTGEELLAWRGRGCQNSSLRKLNRALDKLEKDIPQNKTSNVKEYTNIGRE